MEKINNANFIFDSTNLRNEAESNTDQELADNFTIWTSSEDFIVQLRKNIFSDLVAAGHEKKNYDLYQLFRANLYTIRVELIQKHVISFINSRWSILLIYEDAKKLDILWQ